MRIRNIFLIIIILLLTTCSTIVFAFSSGFNSDFSKLYASNNSSNKEDSIKQNFDSQYNVTYNIQDMDEAKRNKIEQAVKRITQVMCGPINNINESSEDFYKRKSEYSNIIYSPTIPKDPNSFTGYDENSQEYKDSLVAGFNMDIFNQIKNIEPVYDSYGEITIAEAPNFVVTSILLKNAKIKTQSSVDPTKFTYETTNLRMYYLLKEQDNDYRLYMSQGEAGDDVKEYLDSVGEKEDNAKAAIEPTANNDLRKAYDFSKVDSLSDKQLENIKSKNIESMVYLSSTYNNESVANSNGFFIKPGIIATTWSFVENSLINGQNIMCQDYKGNPLEIDGVVTTNPDADYAILKLKNETGKAVNLDNTEVNVEDPIITISTKLGVGYVIQKGICTSNVNYIQTSIPLATTDGGSPIINSNGNVIGINTSKSVNNGLSIADKVNILTDTVSKINNPFSDIKSATFETLKQNYYTGKASEIINNNIPKSKWNKFKKIGDIENKIYLELIKANYANNSVSLRYKNEAPDFISSMNSASSFITELKNQGFSQSYDSDIKKIFDRKDYEVIIMDEQEYLIIVMVKK